MIAFIVASVSDPNDQAFMIELYRQHERLLYSVVKRYIKDFHMREDVLQDALVDLIQNIDKLRALSPASLSMYITAVVRNRAFSRLRAEKLRKEHESSLDEYPENAMSEAFHGIDEVPLKGELREKIERAWTALSQTDQMLLEGKYLLGYSDEELAKRLHYKPNSIRMKLTRARRRAAQQLFAYDEEAML